MVSGCSRSRLGAKERSLCRGQGSPRVRRRRRTPSPSAQASSVPSCFRAQRGTRSRGSAGSHAEVREARASHRAAGRRERRWIRASGFPEASARKPPMPSSVPSTRRWRQRQSASGGAAGLRTRDGVRQFPRAGAHFGTSPEGAGRKRPSARRRGPAASRNPRPRALRPRAQGSQQRPGCAAPT